MEETVGPLSTCRRKLLRGWWRSIGLMVSFMIFTASVQKFWIHSRITTDRVKTSYMKMSEVSCCKIYFWRKFRVKMYSYYFTLYVLTCVYIYTVLFFSKKNV
jgi:hypothetical protein